MKNRITYLWGSDHLMISLGNRIEPRIRTLYCLEFIVTIGMATIVLLEAASVRESWLHWLVSIGSGILYLIAAYRFLSRMFYREKIRVSHSHFSIIRQTPFSHSYASYDWERMGVLHYIGKDAKTDHPLKGKCFDYFGFDTQEQLVQDLHHDGNLYFEFNGVPVRFARGIYSWHAEEIVRMIQLFSGPLLQLGNEWAYMMQEQEWDDV